MIKLPEIGPCNFPQVSIRIGEVTTVAAERHNLSMLFDLPPGLLNQLQHFVNLFSLRIVSQCDARKAAAYFREVRSYIFG